MTGWTQCQHKLLMSRTCTSELFAWEREGAIIDDLDVWPSQQEALGRDLRARGLLTSCDLWTQGVSLVPVNGKYESLQHLKQSLRVSVCYARLSVPGKATDRVKLLVFVCRFNIGINGSTVALLSTSRDGSL